MSEKHEKLNKPKLEQASLAEPLRGVDSLGQAASEDHWFNELIADTRQILLSSLMKMLDRSEAEDVMQESYLKVYTENAKGREMESRPFLFRAARNLAISKLRHKKVVEQSVPALQLHQRVSHEYGSVEQSLSEAEEKELLLDAVNTLPPICRKVFVLRKLDGLSHREIAQRLEISTKTVENHLARGMNLCRQHLSQTLKSRLKQTQVAFKQGELG